ncbi:MAG: zinc-ribbon domain-containing protein [Proteobacteria bacterium]|nr:zinc-ribbon domain-containing protein [Pseudomonadota bacterium]
MRITCPSCASHFELPSELLGKKGRALKCATCQHSWYQAAQVESLDLAAVMGDDYAAQAANPQAGAQPARPQQPQRPQGIQRVPPLPNAQATAAQNARNLLASALGAVEGQRGAQAGALGAPREPGRNVQAAQIRQQQPNPGAPVPGAPAVPPGAVSMMSRRNQFQQRPTQGPGAAPTTAQSWFAGTARAPGAQQQPGTQGGPGAVSWMQQAGAQQTMPQGAPLGMAGDHAGPGAAPLPGQSMRGQAGSAPAPGQGAVSWMNPQGQIVPPGTPGAVPVAMPSMPPGMQGGPGQMPVGAMPGMPPGAMGGPGANVMAAALGVPNSPGQVQAAVMPGQSMRGQAGSAPAPGQGAVSWMNQQGQVVPPGTPGAVPIAMPPGMQGNAGGAPIPGQSMRGQAGMQGAPGEAAVSWMKPGAPGAPGAPGQSMMNPNLPAGPGAAAVSQLSNEIIAPGQGARSLLDGSEAAPGAPGQSMLDKAGAGGQPGQSMLDAGASGGPGAGPQAAAPAAAAAGEEADPFSENGASGGPGAGPAGKKAEAELVAGATGSPKAMGELKTDAAATKDEAGASGGPGAKSAAAAAAAAASGADEDEELVDPDADRPNFGSADEGESEEAAEEAADEGFAQIASRAGGGRAGPATPVKIRKPLDPAYTTAIMMAGFVGIIVATLWFARAELAKILPQIQALYDTVGVEAPKPGDGLSITESSKRLQRIGGVETLVVRGYVANIGEIPRTVPGLRLELYNEKHEVIQSEAAAAPAALLDPAASSEFVIRLELPQLNLAKGGYAVVWDTQAEN